MNKTGIFIAGIAMLMVWTVFEAKISEAAPSQQLDYSSLRELYELLLEKEMVDAYEQQHRLVRKNSRSPSLRLRFGRRSDPSIDQGMQYMMERQYNDEQE